MTNTELYNEINNEPQAQDPANTARVINYDTPVRILIANAKGGCGKTTLATNLASYMVFSGYKTSLIDHDPQGSATDWLDARDSNLPEIHGVPAFERQNATANTRSWNLRVPAGTNRVIIDTPAGIHGNVLSDFIQQADIILIPVVPSAIDIRAATGFIRDVLLSYSFRKKPKPIAVIASRVRKNTLVYSKLERFLSSLKIPFVSELRDTQGYVRASEHGIGLIELGMEQQDQEHWNALIEWIDQVISDELCKAQP